MQDLLSEQRGRPQRMNLRGTALLGLIAASFTGGCGSDIPAITGQVIQEDVSSKQVGDTYRVLVRLPPGYSSEPTRRYPVSFQLDATSFGPQFDIAAGHASNLAAQGTIPETIIVGIGYPYDDPLLGGKMGRSRDYVTVLDNGQPGGIDRFLLFVRQELIPYIDGKYRTDPSARALSGHSLGGFVSLYTMLTTARESSPPFGRFIACDPGSPQKDTDRIYVEDGKLSASTKSLPFLLHYQIARYDGAVQTLTFQETSARLSAHYPDLKLITEVTDTDHGGIISPCILRGLVSAFGGGK